MFNEACSIRGYDAVITAIRRDLIQSQTGMAGPGVPGLRVQNSDVRISNIHSDHDDIILDLTKWLHLMLPDPAKPVQLTLF